MAPKGLRRPSELLPHDDGTSIDKTPFTRRPPDLYRWLEDRRAVLVVHSKQTEPLARLKPFIGPCQELLKTMGCPELVAGREQGRLPT
jgi:hypothetical protein